MLVKLKGLRLVGQNQKTAYSSHSALMTKAHDSFISCSLTGVKLGGVGGKSIDMGGI